MMKPINRMLALLLVAMMLFGMFGAVAETEVTLDAPLDIEGVEPDITLDIPDKSIELTDSLELVSEAPEAAVVSNEAEPIESNEEESPFVINSDGVLVKYTGTAATVRIPENVVIIGQNAFIDNTTMSSVVIPSGVTTIRRNAFFNCTALGRVIVLAKDIAIAETAFDGTQPAFYTVIGSNAADWARKRNFSVQANLLLLDRNIRMNAIVGDSIQLYLNGEAVSTYISNNPAVATVSEKGYVKAVGNGVVRIEAQLESGETRVLTLSVAYPKAYLSKTSLQLNVGSSKTLTVSNLAGRSVTWSSSNSNVATVSVGRVTAISAGRCTITASLSDGKALTCKVTVKDNARLNKTKLSLKVGSSYTLSVKNLGGRTVTWSSSNSNIATVDNGKVTARKAGTCTITARLSNGKTLTCKVTVKDNAKLNKTKLSLKVGSTYTLSVKNLGGRSVTWSSSNTSIATVSGGKVTARKAGKCTITARLSDGKTLTCKVTVTESAKLNRTQLTLKTGETFKLTVSGQKSVTWSSNNVNVATVDANGNVKAVKAGKCIITAKLSSGTSLQCKVTVK